MLTIKKILSFPLFMLLAVLLLVSCGKKSPMDDHDFIELHDGSYEGIIQPLPAIDVYQQGTHMLALEDDDAILIQSRTIDLNKYLEEEVRVEGEVSRGIGNAKDVLTVITVEYLDENRSMEFSPYENKLVGFRFEHPDTWTLTEENDGVTLSLGEDKVTEIQVNTDETDLDTFLKDKEEGDGIEVTIGAQRSMRYLSEGNMRFYVPNPPKKKIYQIRYIPTINKVDDEKGAEKELDLFYDFLESFELIYFTQLSGDKCGGLQKLECPEEYRCELEGAGKYAEGTCVAMGAEVASTSCPFIATPSTCFDYRISEYSKNGCPARYECVEEGSQAGQPTFRDLNVVDAGRMPEEYEDEDATQDKESDDNEIIEDEEEAEDDSTDEELDFEVPDISAVDREYVNTRKNFSLLYPKNWYFASFGPVDGSLWKVGFADKALEEPEEAIITLSLQEKDGGKVSKKIEDTYYVLEGPSSLKEVMSAIADSIEAF